MQPEPMEPEPPRRRYFSGGWSWVLLLGIPFFILGMAVSVGATSDARDAARLKEHGVRTEAEVTGLSTHRIKNSSHPHVDLEYNDDIGLPYETTADYCGERDAFQVGGTATIIYDPDDPELVGFPECRYSTAYSIPLIIGVTFLALGTVLILWMWGTGGWRRRWPAVVWLVLGVLTVAVSFEEDCDCAETVYTGVALIVLGVVPLIAPLVTKARTPSVVD